MQVYLVTNYLPDQQNSMIRLGNLLEESLRAAGANVQQIRATGRMSRLGRFIPKFVKWLGYVDKFVIFPFELRAHARRSKRSKTPFIYHICDHSNAMYSHWLQDVPHMATCNDMLAIRSALGEIPENKTGFTGRILQKWILSGLRCIPRIVCISENSAVELRRILGTNSRAKITSTLLPLNFPFAPLPQSEAIPALRQLVPRLFESSAESGNATPHTHHKPYILHVGNASWYKNRRGVYRIYCQLCKLLAKSGKSAPVLIFAGRDITPDVGPELVGQPDLGIVNVIEPSDSDIQALYSRAELLLYPSLQEGFGWPVAEAMACGTRVVTTGRAPMTEVGGDAAFYIDPSDYDSSANQIVDLLSASPDEKLAQIQRGLQHVKQFGRPHFAGAYLSAYADVLAQFPKDK